MKEKYSSISEFYNRYNFLKVRIDLAREDLLGDKEGVINIHNFEEIDHDGRVPISGSYYKVCICHGKSLVAFLQNFKHGNMETNAFINENVAGLLEYLIDLASFLFHYDNPYAKAFIYELKPLYNKCMKAYEEDLKSCKDS